MSLHVIHIHEHIHNNIFIISNIFLKITSNSHIGTTLKIYIIIGWNPPQPTVITHFLFFLNWTDKETEYYMVIAI
jgi:hypothetical protein